MALEKEGEIVIAYNIELIKNTLRYFLEYKSRRKKDLFCELNRTGLLGIGIQHSLVLAHHSSGRT